MLLASIDSGVFAAAYVPSTDFFDGAGDSTKRRVQQLIDFVGLEAGLRVFRWNGVTAGVFPPNTWFGSWLLAGNTVYINPITTRVWESARGLQQAVQYCRCIVHELGHWRHTDGNWIAGGLAPRWATPEEDEAAWNYSSTFFGRLLGDYALSVRNTQPGKDDSCSLPV